MTPRGQLKKPQNMPAAGGWSDEPVVEGAGEDERAPEIVEDVGHGADGLVQQSGSAEFAGHHILGERWACVREREREMDTVGG